MALGQYILVDKKPVLCEDLMEWGRWMEANNRTVAREEIGGITVSTVFLGLDHSHSFSGKGRPVLFETMLFGGVTENETRRCCTYAEAEAMHRETVEEIRELMTEAALAMGRARAPANDKT